MNNEINIFDYTDFRLYLGDFIKLKKAHKRGYSLEVFSRQCHPLSRSLLSLVISGKRNLTPKNVTIVTRALKLNKKESGYFEHLVQFNQNTNGEDKIACLNQILKYKRPAQNIDDSNKSHFIKWYSFALIELFRANEMTEDAKIISKYFKRRINATEVSRVISNLIKDGFLHRDKSGYLRPTSKKMITSDEKKDLILQSYHASCLSNAKDVLTQDAIEDREFGSLTVNLSQEDFIELKDRIKMFLLETLNSKKNNNKDVVCQLNIQLLKLAEFREENV